MGPFFCFAFFSLQPLARLFVKLGLYNAQTSRVTEITDTCRSIQKITVRGFLVLSSFQQIYIFMFYTLRSLSFAVAKRILYLQIVSLCKVIIEFMNKLVHTEIGHYWWISPSLDRYMYIYIYFYMLYKLWWCTCKVVTQSLCIYVFCWLTVTLFRFFFFCFLWFFLFCIFCLTISKAITGVWKNISSVNMFQVSSAESHYLALNIGILFQDSWHCGTKNISL